jgi:hypothetical protein
MPIATAKTRISNMAPARELTAYAPSQRSRETAVPSSDSSVPCASSWCRRSKSVTTYIATAIPAICIMEAQ